MTFIGTTKKRGKFLALISLLALFVTACTTTGGDDAMPDQLDPALEAELIEVTEQFLADLGTDTALAYESTSVMFKQFTVKEEFDTFVADFENITKVTDSTFALDSIQDEFALLAGTLTFEDESSSPAQIVLAVNGDVWEVAGFDLSSSATSDQPDPELAE